MIANIPAFALTIAEDAFLQPWLWFVHLLENSGMSGIYLAALAMFLAFKFLVAPILGADTTPSSDTAKKRKSGGASSDTAKKRKKGGD